MPPSSDKQPGPLWLTGMMGAGKSTVGRALADRIGRPLVDLDQMLATDRPIDEQFTGDGEAAYAPGSTVHDPIRHDGRRFVLPTNHAGGIEGGITNGEPLVVRAAMKPIPTLARPLPSVDLATREPFDAQKERTDSCAVPACGVVAEAAVAFVLADALLEKTGGDTMDEVRERLERYRARLGLAVEAGGAGDAG